MKRTIQSQDSVAGTRLALALDITRNRLRECIEREGVEACFQQIAMKHQVVWQFSDLLLEDDQFREHHALAKRNHKYIRRHLEALTHAREQLTNAFLNRDVQPIYLKGSAYALTGIEYSGRQSADIDVLFKTPVEYRKALQYLREENFAPVSTLRLCRDGNTECSAVEVRRETPDPPIAVGCYTGWLPDYPSDLLWANVVYIEKLLGRDCRRPETHILCPEAMVLNLLMEMMANCYYRMRDLLDWAMLLDQYLDQINRPLLTEALQQTGLSWLVTSLDGELQIDSGLASHPRPGMRTNFGQRLSQRFFSRLDFKRVGSGLPFMEFIVFGRIRHDHGMYAALSSLSRNTLRALVWRGLRVSGPGMRRTPLRRLIFQGRQVQTLDLELDHYLETPS